MVPKKIFFVSFIALAAHSATAFLVRPAGVSTAVRLAAKAQQQQDSATNHEEFVSRMQHEWKEEADHIDQYKHAVETDKDLEGLIGETKAHVPNPKFMEQEKHRHDSLLHEVAHAIDTDPDLANLVQEEKAPTHQVNANFMDREAHRHDSLLDEVAHAIDSDPDLSA